MTGTRHEAADTDAQVLDLVCRYHRERRVLPPFDPERDRVRCAGRVFGEEESGYWVKRLSVRQRSLGPQLICDAGPDGATGQHVEADHP